MIGDSLLTFGCRYACYARAHNCTEEQMLRQDRLDFGTTYLCGFVVWVFFRQREWRRETGHQGPLGAADEMRFDRWLARRFAPPAHAFGS